MNYSFLHLAAVEQVVDMLTCCQTLCTIRKQCQTSSCCGARLVLSRKYFIEVRAVCQKEKKEAKKLWDMGDNLWVQDV